MNDTLKQIGQSIGLLAGAEIERNGRFFYISKEGKRTKLKAPINEDTEKLNTAADLLGYILSGVPSAGASTR